MEQAFCDTPQEAAGLDAEAAAKTSRWLPDGMAFDAERPGGPTKAETERADKAGRGSDAEQLPAFMQDVA